MVLKSVKSFFKMEKAKYEIVYILVKINQLSTKPQEYSQLKHQLYYL